MLLHNVENHDIERIAKRVNNDTDKIKNWVAFMFMQKGAAMLYMGTEYASDIKPSLFDKELFNKKEDLTAFITKLAKLKKRKIFADGVYQVNIPEVDGVAYQEFKSKEEEYHGIFNLVKVNEELSVSIPDGTYRNYLTGKSVKVQNKKLKLNNDPIIIKVKK